MNITLLKTVNNNNNFAIFNNNYNLKNVSFGSSEVNDIFLSKKPVCNLKEQEKIMKKLAGVLFNPNEKNLFADHAMDQQRLEPIIKKITGKSFEPVLNSKETIEKLLQQTFKQEDIDVELENISNKTFNGTVCLGLNQSKYIKNIDKTIKDIEEKHYAELNPAREKQDATLMDYQDYEFNFLRDKRKLSKEIIILKNEQKCLEEKDKNSLTLELSEVISKKEAEFEKLEEEGLKELKLKKKTFLSAKAQLDQIEEETGLAMYKKLPNSKNITKLSIILGKAYESVAAKEVDRIIIPRVATKLAIKELQNEKEDLSPNKIIKRAGEIQSQLYQVRNFAFGPIEIDHLIVRVKSEPDKVAGTQKSFSNVEAVGIVETKYNPNDLSHGYKVRIENLRWLAGEPNSFERSGYTRKFSEKYYYDADTNMNFHFTPESFKDFSLDTNKKEAYENIYFVTTNKSLVELGKEMLNQTSDSDLESNQIIFNSTCTSTKNLLRKYDQHKLWDNIVFTNDDYCGYSLSNLLFYFKYRDALKNAGMNVFDYRDPSLIIKTERNKEPEISAGSKINITV